jgi:hypothetical protein
MTKYICVTAPPAAVGKGEYVISMPDFAEEVAKCRQKFPAKGLTTTTILHDIVNAIGHRYEAEFPGSGIFALNDYTGVAFATPADLAVVVKRAFTRFYPKIFDSYIDHQIKHRPFGTQLIYFVGDHLNTVSFAANGIDVIEEKDVDVYMGRKEKKTNKGHFGAQAKMDGNVV